MAQPKQIQNANGSTTKIYADGSSHTFGGGGPSTYTAGSTGLYTGSGSRKRANAQIAAAGSSAAASTVPTFQYVDKTGNTKTFTAANQAEALANRPADADPRSGVASYMAPVIRPTSTADTTTETNNTYTSSSRSVREDETDLARDIQERLNGISGLNMGNSGILDIKGQKQQIKNARDDANAVINDRKATLAQRARDTLQGLNDSFEVAQQRMEKTQARSQGKFAVNLARIGGFLGPSASSMGAMQNLEQEFQFELSDLEAKKAAAIQAAMDSESDNEFELAKLALKSADDYDTKMRDAEQNFFNNTMKLSNDIKEEVRDKRDFALKQASNAIDMAVVSGETFEPDDLMGMADILGVSPNSVQAYVDASYNTRKLEEGRKGLGIELDILNYASKQPKGTVFSLGGKQYVGTGTSTDGPRAEVLDRNDIAAYGLPTTLVNYPVDSLVTDIQGKDAPSWFKTYTNILDGVTNPTDFDYQDKWKVYQKSIIDKLGQDDEDTSFLNE